MARIKKGRPLSGVLILDKSQGMSSSRAAQRTRFLFQAQKAGHTGSLDPLATGVLPVCLGEAAKFSAHLLEADKGYVTTARLGVITATGDSEGAVLETRPVPALSVDMLEAVLDRFRGASKQVPTMFSAIKFEGRPLYRYALEGVEIERQARDIVISQLTLDALTPDGFQLTVHCSKGTYIRTLVEDIGLILGCGAHVTQLRRIHAGHFSLAQSCTLEQLQQIAQDSGVPGLESRLLPIDSLLPQYPELYLEGTNLVSIFNGQAVRIPPAEIDGLGLGDWVRIYNTGHSLPDLIDASMFCFAPGRFFIGLGELVSAPKGDGLLLQPRRLIRMPETEVKAQPVVGVQEQTGCDAGEDPDSDSGSQHE